MSRAYRVKLSLAELCVLEDRRAGVRLELLPILDPARMRVLAREAMAERGAASGEVADGRTMLVLPRAQGVEYWIDPDALTIEIVIDHEAARAAHVSIDGDALTREQRIAADRGELVLTIEDLRRLGWDEERLAGEAEHQRVDARRRALEEIERARGLANEVLRDVYRRAITEKARSMGDVTSVSESERDGEYRIRIELQ